MASVTTMTDSAASATPSQVGRPETQKPKARVVVAEASRAQVAIAGLQEAMELRVHAVKDDGIEVLCSTFFPKNTRLDLQLEPPRGYATVEGQEHIAMKGEVGKVQMTDAAPTYRMWIQLENFDPSLLHAVWVQFRSAGPDRTVARSSTSAEIAAPNWALQLLQQGLVEKDQLRQVTLQFRGDDAELEGALMAAGLANAEQIAACKALELSVPFLDVRAYDICMENRTLLSLDVARNNSSFPCSVSTACSPWAWRIPLTWL